MFLNQFKIGADPEFAVVKNGVAVQARTLATWNNRSKSVHEDHSGDVIECTPDPAKSAFLVTKHINQILLEDGFIKALGNDYKLRGGAVVKNRRLLTMGGHVHFERSGLQLTQKLTEALDNATMTLEALDILPHDESKKRRENGMGNGYGKLGDYRDANDGRTFEYRTMCSWMHSPIAAFLCLATAKLAAIEPNVAIENLNYRAASMNKLETFFRYFKDTDAQRAVEKVFEKGLDLQAKPDADIRESWKSINKLYRKRVD